MFDDELPSMADAVGCLIIVGVTATDHDEPFQYSAKTWLRLLPVASTLPTSHADDEEKLLTPKNTSLQLPRAAPEDRVQDDPFHLETKPCWPAGAPIPTAQPSVGDDRSMPLNSLNVAEGSGVVIWVQAAPEQA